MTESVTVFVPNETAAISLGANEIAEKIAAAAKSNNLDIDIVRNGSWGMSWLEPLVEVVVGGDRIAYGPVDVGAVEDLFAADFLQGGEHALKLGPTADIPYLKKQDRWTFRRCGLIDPLSVTEFQAHGGFAGLKRALASGPEHVLEQVKASGLRGRGGAGFPTGIKWQTVASTEAGQKYITCNADEGDSGTFSDRILDGKRPANGYRRNDHRRLCGWRKQRLRLPAL